MIKIENLTINIHKVSVEQDDELLDSQVPSVVRDELVSTLRIISEDSRFAGQTVVIPDACEKYGFAEGEFDLPQLLEFLADMLE
jgi:predicted Zn-ribbon and HTH transcriptional regulator